MCRIFGHIGYQKIQDATLEKISYDQKHGGPDQQKFILRDNWSLGNNRLSIQGLDGGEQPYSLDGIIFSVFNGEIYNHDEIRHNLIKKGYSFSDHCDGSIIPALYAEYGCDLVKYINGMYAIAIIDLRDKPKLLIMVDPAAIKSVYYSWIDDAKTLIFSSELSGIKEFCQKPLEIDVKNIDGYLSGKSIWHGETIYSNVHIMEPSSILLCSLGQQPKVWSYKYEKKDNIHINDFEETAEYFNALMGKQVELMLSADVPVCLVTSGGLDSSYLTALSSQFANNLDVFNIAYAGDWPSDEKKYAEEVAKQYGLRYNQIEIAEHEFPRLLSKTIEYLGQPNSAPHALSTFALFETIGLAGYKVAITGEGADEFFGGYDRFAQAYLNQTNDWLHAYLDKMSAINYITRDELYTDEFKSILGKRTQYTNTIETLNTKGQHQGWLKTLLEFDQRERFPSYILRRVDHLSMANSVEVRVPFCQPDIIDFSYKIPDDFKIKDLNKVKQVIYRAAHKKLPTSILKRKKQPFTLPIVAMLREGHVLYEILNDTLNSHGFKTRNLFKNNIVVKLLDEQKHSPTEKSAEALWSLMILELWLTHSKINLSI